MKIPANILHTWVTAATAGDEMSWNNLFQAFRPGAYSIAIRICKDGAMAADAVQDAFITAYLKIYQLKDPAAFEGWLNQIITRNCYRALSASRRDISLTGVTMESHHFYEDQLNEKMDDLARRQDMYSLLAALPEVLNGVLLLRYFSNFRSYEQIASILQIPIGTVRSRLNEARKKLVEHWRSDSDAGNKFFRENEEWNAFYYAIYGGMHVSNGCKSKFVQHLSEGKIVSPAGQYRQGKEVFERMVAEDREVGSWLEPVNIYSSGDISIIESAHYNSAEHPDHCPASSVVVLYRSKDKVSRMFLHAGEK